MSDIQENRQEPSPFPDSVGKQTQQQDPTVVENNWETNENFINDLKLSPQEKATKAEQRAKAKADEKLQKQKKSNSCNASQQRIVR